MFLACSCNKQGSNLTECNSDGECYCKPNVINRKCTSCKNGFYGFPDCKDTIKGNKRHLTILPYPYTKIFAYITAKIMEIYKNNQQKFGSHDTNRKLPFNIEPLINNSDTIE